MEIRKIVLPIALGTCSIGGISGIIYHSLSSPGDLLDPKNLENLSSKAIKIIKESWKLFYEIKAEIEKYPLEKENLKDFWLN